MLLEFMPALVKEEYVFILFFFYQVGADTGLLLLPFYSFSLSPRLKL